MLSPSVLLPYLWILVRWAFFPKTPPEKKGPKTSWKKHHGSLQLGFFPLPSKSQQQYHWICRSPNPTPSLPLWSWHIRPLGLNKHTGFFHSASQKDWMNMFYFVILILAETVQCVQSRSFFKRVVQPPHRKIVVPAASFWISWWPTSHSKSTGVQPGSKKLFFTKFLAAEKKNAPNQFSWDCYGF